MTSPAAEGAPVARRQVRVGPVVIGGGAPLAVIAGPCVIESRDAALRHAERLAAMAARAGVGLVYKSSFDKANRTALESFRGVGLERGLAVLEEVRRETGLPVLTDVHEAGQAAAVAAVVDVLQTPAFLCRQTDFILAVAAAGRPVNLKKGQFLSPAEMAQVVRKARAAGNEDLLVTERGFVFGYQALVADMRALPVLAATGCPVVFDATHSVQQPGAQGTASGGERAFVVPLARAAVAAGVDAVFLEVHEDPSRALSDGATSLALADLPALLAQLVAVDRAVRGEAG
jgi:2-dehydro-3-deoxyphosphooctonate aldolase (KDO 8-P synthase)